MSSAESAPDPIRVLVAGATGATGRLLVEQLLDRGFAVTALARSADRLPQTLRTNDQLEVIEGTLLSLPDDAVADLAARCPAFASCLGHNLTVRGVFGPPWRLVRDSAKRYCRAAEANPSHAPRRCVLMNSAGVRHRGRDEPASVAHQVLLGLIRVLIPPHADNEGAAEFLRTQTGAASAPLEWVVVRPDSLIDEETPTDYELHPSPTRSALFNPGKTSRINVARFMAELLANPESWTQWRGQMPVIYNRDND